ncbi:unnamed protein product, partial [Amoebophrya sp. A25]
RISSQNLQELEGDHAEEHGANVADARIVGGQRVREDPDAPFFYARQDTIFHPKRINLE